MTELQMLRQMRVQPSGLSYKERGFVKGVSIQFEKGRRTEPSEKQAKVIRDIYRRWKKNQEPHFVQGGLPGLGKRR
jgi:hypothetical protein